MQCLIIAQFPRCKCRCQCQYGALLWELEPVNPHSSILTATPPAHRLLHLQGTVGPSLWMPSTQPTRLAGGLYYCRPRSYRRPSRPYFHATIVTSFPFFPIALLSLQPPVSQAAGLSCSSRLLPSTSLKPDHLGWRRCDTPFTNHAQHFTLPLSSTTSNQPSAVLRVCLRACLRACIDSPTPESPSPRPV